MRVLFTLLLLSVLSLSFAAPQKRSELTSEEYADETENLKTANRKMKVTTDPSYEDEILEEEAELTTVEPHLKKLTTFPASDDPVDDVEEDDSTTKKPKMIRKGKSTTKTPEMENDEETITKKPKTVKKYSSEKNEEVTTGRPVTKTAKKPKVAFRKATQEPESEEQFVKRNDNAEEEVGILKLQKPEVMETACKPKNQTKKAVEEKKEKRAEEFAVHFEEETVSVDFKKAVELKKGMFVMLKGRPTKLTKVVVNKFDVFLEGENLFEEENHNELVPKSHEVETLSRFLKDYKLISVKNNMANLISLDGKETKKNIPFANDNILKRAEAGQDLIIIMLTLSDEFKAEHNLLA